MKSKTPILKMYQYPSKAAEMRMVAIVNRGLGVKKKDLAAVTRIIADVKKNGDQALIKYVNRFDSPTLDISSLKVSPAEWKQAEKTVGRPFMRALDRARIQIETFHQKQLTRSWLDTSNAGKLLGQLVNPVDSAGVYVPGGTAGKTPLVSSVLMGAIPAKIAGVRKVSLVTPPDKSGSVNPHILAAAKRVGVDAVYKVGSAWAIAALAYGTETIPQCNVIVGPGNIYVTLAKKILAGTVGIDIIAGPSEILVIADNTAIPAFIAADLLSQAEHDRFASALLVTTSATLARAVSEAVTRQLRNLARRDIAEKSLETYGAVMIVPDIATAFEFANRIAPEHLELHIQHPLEQVARIQNAGAVFIGDYTPEPVGDYIAGPNHVLPTAGTARFASALSVDNFIKKTSLIYYSKETFKQEAADIMRLAETEGLDAHANSVKVRLQAS
ncbi:MAG: histidinol dehydrogenase [Thermodesulfobacteriota bacterium]